MAMLERRLAPKKVEITLGPIRSDLVLNLARTAGLKLVPLDVEGLAVVLGVDVRYEPMDMENSGKISRSGRGHVITINALHHPNRKRFTLAHEIGHYCLHRSMQVEFVDEVFFRDETTSPVEREANRFAADILMPEDAFREFAVKNSSKVEDIADHFQVSSLAVRFRAKQLGFQGHGLS